MFSNAVLLMVDKDWKGKTITVPKTVWVDHDVSQKISSERIVLGVTPNNTLVVISRNGKYASKRNGGRSLLKVITNEEGWKRAKGAAKDDYTRNALYKPSNTVSSTYPPPVKPRPTTPIPPQPQPQRDPPPEPLKPPHTPRAKSVVQLHIERMRQGMAGYMTPTPQSVNLNPPATVTPLPQRKKSQPLLWPSFRSSKKPSTSAQGVTKQPTNAVNELKVVLSNGDTVYGTPDAIAAFTSARNKQKHR